MIAKCLPSGLVASGGTKFVNIFSSFVRSHLRRSLQAPFASRVILTQQTVVGSKERCGSTSAGRANSQSVEH